MSLRRILSFLLVCLFIFAASGCGNSVTASQADTDAVKAALDKFYACKSFTATRVTEYEEVITVENEKQTYIASSEMELILITQPQAQMMTGNYVKMENNGDAFEQANCSYIVPENGGYTEYYFDGTDWYSVSTDDSAALEGIGANIVTASYFVDQLSFGKAGEENLEGGKASRYDGVLSGEALVEMLEASGQLSDISTMSENQQQKIKSNLVKDLDEVTVSVWIDQASGYPARFELSLNNILADLEKSISKSLGNKDNSDWDITKYVISTEVKDFDAVSEIVLPPDASSATALELE